MPHISCSGAKIYSFNQVVTVDDLEALAFVLFALSATAGVRRQSIDFTFVGSPSAVL